MEWATAMIDKAVDKRIEGLNDRSYKELGDFGSDFRYEDNKNEE